MLVSCGTTPADRIEENPEIFAVLPNWEKDLVVQGKVAAGMSPDAVKLSWGNPNSILSGQDKKKYVQRWIYSAIVPVETMPGWGYPGWGYRRYIYEYPYGYPYGWYSQTATDYVPVNVAYVLFENGKVVSWESKN